MLLYRPSVVNLNLPLATRRCKTLIKRDMLYHQNKKIKIEYSHLENASDMFYSILGPRHKLLIHIRHKVPVVAKSRIGERLCQEVCMLLL